MMTVHEVSDLTGLSIRTIQYYDRIGLLKPAEYTEYGYRLYDTPELERLQQIMLFRELEFPLKDIKTMINSPSFDRERALRQQIKLLSLRKEQIDKLIILAENMLKNGGKEMDFEAFDTKKYKEYAEEARKTWGDTTAFKEYEERSKGRTDDDNMKLADKMMDIFREFGEIKLGDPGSQEAEVLVRKLQKHITDNYYKCTDEILTGLGQMYAAEGEFKVNIDRAGGEGTADFVNRAIITILKK